MINKELLYVELSQNIMTPQVLRCIHFSYSYAHLRNGLIFRVGIHKAKVFLNCKSELNDSLVMWGDVQGR
jgi:hypothetical protein